MRSVQLTLRIEVVANCDCVGVQSTALLIRVSEQEFSSSY